VRQFTCIHCGAQLSLPDKAVRVVCPKCLYVASVGALNPAPVAQGAPLPVIPIENEVANDLDSSSMAILIVAAFIGIGGVMAFLNGAMSHGFVACFAAIVFGITGFSRWESGRNRPQRVSAAGVTGADDLLDDDVLPYRAARDERVVPKTSFAGQAAMGMGVWVLGVVLVVIAVRDVATARGVLAMPTQQVVTLIIGGAVLAIGGLGLWLRLRFKWRGFIPGLLLGFGLTCLVPIGIVFVICGGLGK
jgi:hypothetical protein